MQSRVKVKELQNAYDKMQEANHHSGGVPMTCWFYKELDTILSGDPTSTEKSPVDTLGAHMSVKIGPSQEEEILDEAVEVEGDPETGDGLVVRYACSQDLFSTLESRCDKSTAERFPVNSSTPPGQEAQAKSTGECQPSTYRSEDTTEFIRGLDSVFGSAIASLDQIFQGLHYLLLNAIYRSAVCSVLGLLPD
ncbi:hypothetical protein UY3_06723 [Chelonia mydas]|uniref:Uncharacterized protein n=1 Tax=Chelonia mydas TaxID=8469 RepID=M7C6D1_CHEMY|nr:hypothetical protein UY3_06723 [Chelonia mydas]